MHFSSHEGDDFSCTFCCSKTFLFQLDANSKSNNNFRFALIYTVERSFISLVYNIYSDNQCTWNIELKGMI